LQRLVNLQYNRNNIEFARGQFRGCGDNGKNSPTFRFAERSTQAQINEEKQNALLPKETKARTTIRKLS